MSFVMKKNIYTKLIVVILFFVGCSPQLNNSPLNGFFIKNKKMLSNSVKETFKNNTMANFSIYPKDSREMVSLSAIFDTNEIKFVSVTDSLFVCFHGTQEINNFTSTQYEVLIYSEKENIGYEIKGIKNIKKIGTHWYLGMRVLSLAN